MRLSSSLSTAHINRMSEQKTQKKQNKSNLLDFTTCETAMTSKSNLELFRSILVYRICRIPFLVHNASSLLSLSYKMLGPIITNKVIKMTFFDQFCAGEDVQNIQAKLRNLNEFGVGAIFDYAAESDANSVQDDERNAISSEKDTPFNQPARVYDYKSEQQCDFHLNTFRSCINAVRNLSPNGNSFAAVKVTALGNPILLERNSAMISQIRELFTKFNVNNDGILTRTEFEDGFRHHFDVHIENILPEFVDKLDPNNTNSIDVIDFSRLLTPQLLPEFTLNMKNTNSPLYHCTPTNKEIRLLEAMYDRAHNLAKLAFDSNVRLLFDAEQSYYQPSIDNLVLNLQETYNSIHKTDIPIVFNTYQCYLKEAIDKLETDLERSRRYSYHFGIKLVRGAYMNSERERALQKGYESPIHDCIEDTHQCYDQVMEKLFQYDSTQRKNLVEIMCASHNQNSIEQTLEFIEKYGKDKNTVHFAQLLGMSDHLTYTLGVNGYRSYKYTPYGKVGEVIPYLLRRLEENSSLLGNAKTEQMMAWNELKKRITSIVV